MQLLAEEKWIPALSNHISRKVYDVSMYSLADANAKTAIFGIYAQIRRRIFTISIIDTFQ